MNAAAPPDEMKYTIEAWKQSVDVQQHFNEICMKIRNYYITVVTALLALIGVILSRVTDPFFAIGPWDVHTALPVLAAIVLASYLFYFIDRHWYHRLLLGAVRNALEIENHLDNSVTGIQLTTKIGDASPIDVSSWAPGSVLLWLLGVVFGADPRIRRDNMIHSDAKISIFYKSIAAMFAVLFVATALSGGVTPVSNAASDPVTKSVGPAVPYERV